MNNNEKPNQNAGQQADQGTTQQQSGRDRSVDPKLIYDVRKAYEPSEGKTEERSQNPNQIQERKTEERK